MWYIPSANVETEVDTVHTTVVIDADPDTVYAALLDVPRWCELTASITEATWLDDGPTQVGRRARVRQPRLPSAIWQVTDLRPDEAFGWQTRSPGVRMFAGHHIEAGPGDGTVTLRLTLDVSGPLAGVTRLFWGRLIRRYVGMEAAGFASRCGGVSR